MVMMVILYLHMLTQMKAYIDKYMTDAVVNFILNTSLHMGVYYDDCVN
jgi:hypothetical protein